MLRWPAPREALIDWPAAVTEFVATWYRLYFTVAIAAIALILPVTVLTTLALWLFGIRWGW